MEIKNDLQYLPSHEWVKFDGGKAKIGITDFAQNELGDIVFVELPEVGDEISADNEFANVESVKAVSPINSPVSGKVISVNSALEDVPELINEKPYDAWFVEVEVSEKSANLLDAEKYQDIAK